MCAIIKDLDMKLFIERLRREYIRNDDKILYIINQVGIPTPFNFIQELSCLPKGQLYRILTNLEKYGFIKKSTIAKSTFYDIKRR